MLNPCELPFEIPPFADICLLPTLSAGHFRRLITALKGKSAIFRLFRARHSALPFFAFVEIHDSRISVFQVAF